jgi:hypothetical protein
MATAKPFSIPHFSDLAIAGGKVTGCWSRSRTALLTTELITVNGDDKVTASITWGRVEAFGSSLIAWMTSSLRNLDPAFFE